MSKPIIAIDIDDVLAQGTEAMRLEVNRVARASLQPEHYQVPGPYWQYYESVWRAHGIEVDKDTLNEQMIIDQSHVPVFADAQSVLKQLSSRFEFVVITARNPQWEKATHSWLTSNFPGVFSGVHFGGHHGSNLSKGALCKQLGATWLIDDNIDHAHTAIEEGVGVILFGEYGWHKEREVHPDVVRCQHWVDILEFFDGQIR